MKRNINNNSNSHPKIPQKVNRILESAKRDDRTIVIANLDSRVDEEKLKKYFEKQCGEVSQVKLVYDQHYKKFKGIAYVEFKNFYSARNALDLTGKLFLGQPLRIHPSQAEKNRAAKATKEQKELLYNNGPRKLLISGFNGILLNMSSGDLMHILEPFGPILNIELSKNEYTGKNLGFGYVEYDTIMNAAQAAKALDNFQIAGCTLRTTLTQDLHEQTEYKTNEYAKIATGHIDNLKSSIASVNCPVSNCLRFITQNNIEDKLNAINNYILTYSHITAYKLMAKEYYVRLNNEIDAIRIYNAILTETKKEENSMFNSISISFADSTKFLIKV